jgi:hypothetical protein
VTDEQKAAYAAGWRAGAEKMRDVCAGEVDCGCAAREDVLARLATDGYRRASYLCPHGDVCCALQAQFLRDAPLPPVEYPETRDGE